MENFYKLFLNSSGICTDTRNMTDNCMFICLSGENFNGNKFANDALNKKAKYVIVDEKELANDTTILYVNNTLQFLQKLANFHRKQFNIPIIGITGSNGKTSTKELINSVLSQKFNTLATIGNLNNHIGVPLTLLRLTKEHEIAIIEMGANKFKDIEELCQIAEPNYGIITNIGKAHLQGFLNFEGVLKTKTELYEAVALQNGNLFVNADDAILMNNLPKNISIKTYGTQTAELKGELIELNPFVKLKWKYQDYLSEEIQTSMLGKYNFYNFLAAIRIGLHFEVESEKINEAIQHYSPSNNRSQILKTTKNTLILDAYNANPSSMKSAIESFNEINQDEKMMILGDMFELGSESTIEHKKIIDLVQELNLNSFFVGEQFYQEKNNTQLFFKNIIDLEKHLKENKIEQQLILLKASRGIGLEKVQDLL